MSGKSLAAIIALATVPIIARLFSPADFGAAAIFLSTVGIASTVATLRYGRAIVLPKFELTATRLFGFSHRVSIAYSLLTLLLIFLLDKTGINVRALELVGDWKWVIPVGVWLTAVVGIQDSWITRNKAFPVLSTSLVVGNSTSSGVRIGLGVLQGSTVSGLIIGELLGKIGRLAVQYKICKKSVSAIFDRQTWKYTIPLARQYSDFPLFNAPAGLIFTLGQNLPVLLFGTMFGPAVAGFYAMANRISRVPMTIVATSMRRVFLQKAADITNRKRSLLKAFALSTITLALIGLVPFLVIYRNGQQVLVWLLGADWEEAGRYLQVIAPWLLSIWLTVPCNPIFVVLRKQIHWLVMTSTLTILRFAAFGIAQVAGYDPIETLRLFILVTLIGHSITIFVTISLIRTSRQSRQNSVPTLT